MIYMAVAAETNHPFMCAENGTRDSVMWYVGLNTIPSNNAKSLLILSTLLSFIAKSNLLHLLTMSAYISTQWHCLIQDPELLLGLTISQIILWITAQQCCSVFLQRGSLKHCWKARENAAHKMFRIKWCVVDDRRWHRWQLQANRFWRTAILSSICLAVKLDVPKEGHMLRMGNRWRSLTETILAGPYSAGM